MPATVVITGASSGIGLELCKQLTARGDVVYATCRNSNADLEAVGVTGGVVAGIDVTSAECAAKLRAALKDVSIDVLINNAGSMGSKPGLSWDEQTDAQKFASLDLDTLALAFDVNVVGPVRVTKALVEQVKEGTGKVVIVSSLMGSVGDNSSGGLMAYRCSKSAVNMAGVTMAQELRGKKIAVGLVHPGCSEPTSAEASRLRRCSSTSGPSRAAPGGGAGDGRALDGDHGRIRAWELRRGPKPLPW